MYGDIPDGGGFNQYTELEVGLQHMTEAVHCILGSLSKVANDSAMEVEHITDELRLAVEDQKEYKQPIYIDQLTDGRYVKSGAAAKSIESMRKSAMNLSKVVKRSQGKLKTVKNDWPVSMYRLAEACFKVLEVTADRVLVNFAGYPGKPIDNPFVEISTLVLADRVKAFFKEYK